MHLHISISTALLALAASGIAQDCTNPPAQRTFSNREEFGASFYYNLANHFFDLDVQRDITISSIQTWTYDQGAGNPIVPNQVGATGQVDFYTCPTTRLGNETLAPGTAGSPWTLLGSGTITIVATPAESTVVFNPPLVLPAGVYGCALEYLPTTTGPNPGPLHCLGISPNPGTPSTDQFLTFSNDGIQGTAWGGAGQDSPNLRITYTPEAQSAHWVSVAEGCYFRPYGFYESFPASATAPDVANTSQQWVFVGDNYVVAPGAGTFTPSTSPSLTLGAPGASSSTGTWDDALSTPITLPFTFPYPGGSTNTITIGSNGCIYLAFVTDASYDYCGASYGSIVPFRDNEARLAAYFHDLDPSAGGSIHYDVDPSNQAVTITWDSVPEWPVASALNSIQVTLDAAGTVNLTFGNLANTGIGNGNNALLGFTPGLGSRLPPPIDFSAAIPYTSGDGAIPPVLSLDARPVIGATVNVVTENVTTGTLLQVLAVGDALQATPLDLGSIGMPGCLLSINPFVFLTNAITGSNTFTQPFMIPNNPTLQNVQLVFQAAPLTGGFNQLGLLVSNGVCARVGQ